MAEKKKLSVEEILAAARKSDGGAKGGAKPADPAPAAPVEPVAPNEPAAETIVVKPSEAKPAAPKPAAKPAAGGARPSIAEMMAAARAEKSLPAAPKAAEPAPAVEAPPPAAATPAPAKKPAPKPAAKEKEAEVPAVTAEKDTSSILAAARKSTKPGPLSKSEAAAVAKPAAAATPARAAAKPKVAVPPMPPKPEYAKPKEKAVVEEDRRFFLLAAVGSFLAIGFTSLAATITLWTLGTARFMFPNILTEPPSKFKVGFPADYPPGYVENKFKAQYGIWVVNTEYNGQREIFALSTVCTHLGCTPNWLDGEQKFKCPCHGSGFYKDGINFEGPAPRPLERYAIRLSDDGQLEVDKSKKFQEELGQWNDTSSFVQV